MLTENSLNATYIKYIITLVKALMSHKLTCSFIIICFTGICPTAQIIVKSGSSLFLTGSDIQIRCKCYMNPSGTYTFLKDGATLNSGGHITVDRNKVLIKNATTEDSGSYTCTASSPSSVTKTPDSPLSISVIGMFKKSPFLFCKLLFSLWIAVKGKKSHKFLSRRLRVFSLSHPHDMIISSSHLFTKLKIHRLFMLWFCKILIKKNSPMPKFCQRGYIWMVTS